MSVKSTEAERKVYDTVIAKFNVFFKLQRNVIFEHNYAVLTTKVNSWKILQSNLL